MDQGFDSIGLPTTEPQARFRRTPSMAVDITALYCCLDDFCKVLADWEAHRLLPSEPGFTHEVPEVERYVCFGNCESSSALSGAAISKPRRVIAERAQLPERSDA